MRHDQVQTLNLLLDGLDAAALDARMVAAGARGEGGGRRGRHRGRAHRRAVRTRHALCRPDAYGRGAAAGDAWRRRHRRQRGDRPRRLRKAYAAAFGRLLPGIPVRIVSLRTAAIGRRPAFDLAAFAPGPMRRWTRRPRARGRSGSTAPGTRRRIWSRLDLPVGAVDRGAGDPGAARRDDLHRPRPRGRVDRFGNVIVERCCMTLAIDRACCSSICRTTSSIPTAPMPAAGRRAPAIAALPARLKPLADALRAKGGGSSSDAVHAGAGPGRRADHLAASEGAAAVPRQGRFRARLLGPALVDELAPADLAVEKVAYSAFYMTRLEWVLRKAGVDQLVVGGIVTNGGVASTVRDAHVRDIECTCWMTAARPSRRGASGGGGRAASGRAHDDRRRGDE